MGKNWSEYITEAKRCLVTNGILIIAETTKFLKWRLTNLRDEIQKQGFDIYSYEERGDFTFIEARELWFRNEEKLLLPIVDYLNNTIWCNDAYNT